MDASWQIRYANSKETYSHDAAHIIDLHLNILTPVPDILTVKLMKISNLLEPHHLKINVLLIDAIFILVLKKDGIFRVDTCFLR